jgi:hypothetical protein
VLNNIAAPGWVFKAILLVLALGFPLVLFFAWAFELTPEGLKKEKEVDRSQSITHVTGRKLDFVIIALLALALGYLPGTSPVVKAPRYRPLPLPRSGGGCRGRAHRCRPHCLARFRAHRGAAVCRHVARG